MAGSYAMRETLPLERTQADALGWNGGDPNVRDMGLLTAADCDGRDNGEASELAGSYAMRETLPLERTQADALGWNGGDPNARDMGLLESAVAQPRATFAGELLHKDVFEMAAAYLFHIVKNHPFVDGNKRTGTAAALTFLGMNDIVFGIDRSGLYDITIRTAQGPGRQGGDRRVSSHDCLSRVEQQDRRTQGHEEACIRATKKGRDVCRGLFVLQLC